MNGKIEDIKWEIDRYTATLVKIRKAIPLVVIIALLWATGLVYFDVNNTTIHYMSITAMIMYVSSFALAYYQCTTKIKKLKERLKNVRN
jgi:hypothetical protein